MKILYHRQIKKVEHWGDNPNVISSYLKKGINKGDYIYIADYEPILYFLVDAKCPTKFVLPAWLYSSEFNNFIGIDPIKELDNIIKKKPIYLIKISNISQIKNRNQYFYNKLDNYIERFYIFERKINGVDLFKLKKE
jgi:hypothetical protein